MLHSRWVENVKTIGTLVPLGLTHKKSRDNVLISAARKAAPRSYQFAPFLNDKLARLSDHVTG